MPLTRESVSPKAVVLPPLPAADPLTAAQWKTLLAIADSVIPAIKPVSIANTKTDIPTPDKEYSTAISTLKGLTPEADGEAVAEAYLQHSAASSPAFKEGLQRVIALYLPQSSRKELGTVLSLLNTRPGSLLFTGHVTPISDQPVQIRESIIQAWATARVPLLRQLYRSLTMLTKTTWVKTTDTLPHVLGVPRVPVGMVPGKGHDYEFIQFPPGNKEEIIETDVVIVGSGCGAGVCAKNLAEAGNRVIVVEKSYHWTPEHFPMSASNGWHHLYMDGGMISCKLSSSVYERRWLTRRS